MSDRFTVNMNEYGELEVHDTLTDPPFKFIPDLTKAVLSYAQAFRDRELGRWRDPENPDVVVYRNATFDDTDGRCIRIHDERQDNASRVWEGRRSTAHPEHQGTAERYFRAHPVLPTAVGAIIEGGGLRLHLVGSGKCRWFDPYRGNFKTDNQAVAFLGPDWRVIHEGMEEDDDH